MREPPAVAHATCQHTCDTAKCFCSLLKLALKFRMCRRFVPLVAACDSTLCILAVDNSKAHPHKSISTLQRADTTRNASKHVLANPWESVSAVTNVLDIAHCGKPKHATTAS